MRARIWFVLLAGIAIWMCGSSGIVSAQTVQLSRSVSPDALKLPSFGDLPAQQTLPLQIWFKPRNQAQLNKLLADQQDPKSSQYHKWLTPQEYTQRFGVTQAEFDKVSNWLTSEGFQVTGGSPEDGYIKFKGNALSIGHAFGTRIARFSSDGSKYGNLNEPQIPAEYGALVGSVTGLDNLHASKAMSAGHVPHAVISPSRIVPGPGSLKSPSKGAPIELALVGEDPEIKITGSGTHLGPSDFYTFYDETPLKNAGFTGSGCIAPSSEIQTSTLGRSRHSTTSLDFLTTAEPSKAMWSSRTASTRESMAMKLRRCWTSSGLTRSRRTRLSNIFWETTPRPLQTGQLSMPSAPR